MVGSRDSVRPAEGVEVTDVEHQRKTRNTPLPNEPQIHFNYPSNDGLTDENLLG
jgi:hypothetical protein